MMETFASESRPAAALSRDPLRRGESQKAFCYEREELLPVGLGIWIRNLLVLSQITSSHTPQSQTQSSAPLHTQEAIRTQGVLGKHPHWTKIERSFLLIPDEQVLLFKGPNPLQSTHWNPNPRSPLLISTVCVSPLFFPFAVPGLRAEKKKKAKSHERATEICTWKST